MRMMRPSSGGRGASRTKFKSGTKAVGDDGGRAREPAVRVSDEFVPGKEGSAKEVLSHHPSSVATVSLALAGDLSRGAEANFPNST